ncbi:MAG TPA: pepsin/retropepsin-like aspartic protease family protein [Phycisphaerales bacterium]|nr:pepsin/retropepsin-like aspartic protease family protein [Phycisphaerales bacterium]
MRMFKQKYGVVWWLGVGGCLALAVGCQSEPRNYWPEAIATLDPTVILDVPLNQPMNVTINGAFHARMGFDSGQSIAVMVNPTFAAEMKLPVVGHASASDGKTAHGASIDVIQVDSITVENAVFPNVQGIVLDSTRSGINQRGSLGFPLFETCLLTLDFPHNRLIARAGELPSGGEPAILPYTLEQNLPVIEMTIADQRMSALVDSGSDEGIVLPKAYAERVPLNGPLRSAGHLETLFNTMQLWKADLKGEVHIGEIVLRNPTLTFTDGFDQPEIGKAFLKNYAVTFDQKNRRLRITSGSSE